MITVYKITFIHPSAFIGPLSNFLQLMSPAAPNHQIILPVSSVYKYFAFKQNKVLQAEIAASFL
jgi:hypothetical protein